MMVRVGRTAFQGKGTACANAQTHKPFEGLKGIGLRPGGAGLVECFVFSSVSRIHILFYGIL